MEGGERGEGREGRGERGGERGEGREGRGEKGGDGGKGEHTTHPWVCGVYKAWVCARLGCVWCVWCVQGLGVYVQDLGVYVQDLDAVHFDVGELTCCYSSNHTLPSAHFPLHTGQSPCDGSALAAMSGRITFPRQQ